MTVDITPATGVEAFVAALEGFDSGPVVASGLVIYTVVPVIGALAGQAVHTGVPVAEVAPWPMSPPHWIHLPADVTFTASNIGSSPMPGWRSHSRDIKGWGTAASPVAAWLAHVRGVLGGAQ